MRSALLTLGLLGAANAYSIGPRQKETSSWAPKTKDPHFFNLRVDDNTGTLSGYATRLEKGIAIATPYNKWWDPKLPTFFVDDDTQMYTVSKEPLQVYIDSVSGAVRYTKLGWLPPSAMSLDFFHTGNNPLQLIEPSPSYLTWPSTPGIAFSGDWLFCPLGGTGQYQLFVYSENFAPQGVTKDTCIQDALAAVNANPWQSVPAKPSSDEVSEHGWE